MFPRIILFFALTISCVTNTASAQSSAEAEAKAKLDSAKAELERIKAEADPLREVFERAKAAWEQKSAQLEQAKRAVVTAASAFEAAQSSAALAKGGFKAGMVFRDCPDCPEMVIIPSGSFLMGSPASDKNGSDKSERPQHRVTIGRPIALGKYEVTQAEWEYAARADSDSAYSFGDDEGKLNQYGWFGRKPGEPGEGTHPVGQLRPNHFGLHDMHGNVWEWTEDCFLDTYVGAPTDGSANDGIKACNRILRGGGWHNNPRELRSASRGSSRPVYTDSGRGFRLARRLP